MTFDILVNGLVRKEYAVKQLGQMKKEVKRITQISWIFSKKFVIRVEVANLDEAKTICEKIGCDYNRIQLNFSEC